MEVLFFILIFLVIGFLLSCAIYNLKTFGRLIPTNEQYSKHQIKRGGRSLDSQVEKVFGLFEKSLEELMQKFFVELNKLSAPTKEAVAKKLIVTANFGSSSKLQKAFGKKIQSLQENPQSETFEDSIFITVAFCAFEIAGTLNSIDQRIELGLQNKIDKETSKHINDTFMLLIGCSNGDKDAIEKVFKKEQEKEEILKIMKRQGVA